ncbi:adenylosuccinate lyase [Streptomyces sp. H39-S7]|uniref:adenylosuccinate lyase n=1 Tax=Streptomyces sp. H39-S7 TaxID=3004357 RepID=UPI0022AF65F9|nr:adenylosuccinate lyase [Streptomyces sp. H39-S7]MCZ4123746.1 adenylosuccinate lyase [Streptomyces sp. H39-S7]
MDSAARDELAGVLTAPGQPLEAREAAAVALAAAGDRRAFETLALLLNYREPARAETAARALALLGDPRTARAAAALATNPLRVAYALHPIRLLVQLRAPESVPALIETLDRLLAEQALGWDAVPACVEGLGELGDPRAATVLRAACAHSRLRAAATAALERIGCSAADPYDAPDASGGTPPS